MLHLGTLFMSDDAKMIVIDEGLKAPYGKRLIIGCLKQRRQTLKEKNNHSKVEVLSFSDPAYRFVFESGSTFYVKNATVHDCYTFDLMNAVTGESDFEELERVINIIERGSIVIVDCLSSLMLNVGVAKCYKVLKKVCERSSQLICVHRRHFASENRISSSIETLGSTYVKLSDYLPSYAALCDSDKITYAATIVHRKAGGLTLCQSKLLTQSISSYEIIEEKEAPWDDLAVECLSRSHDDEVVHSSFRIQTSDREMKEKNKTSLPYVITANSAGSKILYRPEDIDDLDEDDPDDDLCF